MFSLEFLVCIGYILLSCENKQKKIKQTNMNRNEKAEAKDMFSHRSFSQVLPTTLAEYLIT